MKTHRWKIIFDQYWVPKDELTEWLGISALRLKHAIERLAYGKRYSKRGKKCFNDRLFTTRTIDGKSCIRVDRNALDRLIDDQYQHYPLPSQPKPQPKEAT